MKAIALEGFEPRVQVFVVGREAPIEPSWVGTRRGPDEPWVRFQVHGPARGEKADPNSAWIPDQVAVDRVPDRGALRLDLKRDALRRLERVYLVRAEVRALVTEEHGTRELARLLACSTAESICALCAANTAATGATHAGGAAQLGKYRQRG